MLFKIEFKINRLINLKIINCQLPKRVNQCCVFSLPGSRRPPLNNGEKSGQFIFSTVTSSIFKGGETVENRKIEVDIKTDNSM